jgi:hypothetical protein
VFLTSLQSSISQNRIVGLKNKTGKIGGRQSGVFLPVVKE